MNIHVLTFNPFQENTYIIYDEQTKAAAIIDAGCMFEKEQQQLENDTRVVMHLHPLIAPIKACVCPLTKKLSEPATAVYAKLAEHFNVEYDEAGSIGKRYRRQDAIGTPYCVTFDFDSLDDQCVTIRERDSMQQHRVPIDALVETIQESMTLSK